MNILQYILKFTTQTASTNSAMEIVDSIKDIRYGHKRARGIWCFTMALLGAGGAGALFVLEPSVLAYFQPIVLKTLPFLGDIGSKIGVGLIGAWFGAGFGHNTAKEVVKYYSEKTNGVSNMAYKFDYAKLEQIINANLALFNLYPLDREALQRAEGVDRANAIEEAYENEKTRKIVELGAMFEYVQSKILEHQDDQEVTVSHDQYKNALLIALRQYNLPDIIRLLRDKYSGIELQEKLIIDLAKKLDPENQDPLIREAREVVAPLRGATGRRGRNQFRERAQEMTRQQGEEEREVEVAVVQDGGLEMERVEVQPRMVMNPYMQQLPLVRDQDHHQEQAGAREQQRARRPDYFMDIPISKHVGEYYSKLAGGTKKDARREVAINEAAPLEILNTYYDKQAVLQQMAQAKAALVAKRTELNKVIPRDLKKYVLGSPVRRRA